MDFKTKLFIGKISALKSSWSVPLLRWAINIPPLRGVRGVFILTLFLLITNCFQPTTCQAQNWNEWFKQKKTQRKYLAKQIALLQVYLGYLKKGYEIADKGITTINNIKNGDFNLHRDFFGSLTKVNPHIVNSAKVADILAFQIHIVDNLKRVNNFCKNNKQFTPEEIRYVAAVYTNMLALVNASIAELLMVVEPNQTQMKDDERLTRIEDVYAQTRERLAFSQAFDQQVRLLAAERQQESRSLEQIRLFHHIH